MVLLPAGILYLKADETFTGPADEMVHLPAIKIQPELNGMV